jgi:hypothetical protein
VSARAKPSTVDFFFSKWRADYLFFTLASEVRDDETQTRRL